MKVSELTNLSDFKAITLPEPERDIVGAYAGDLLSWVMGRASEDNAWITIMSNSNVIAVATLTDVSCIILAESVMPDSGVAEIATAKGVNLISSSKSTYEIAKILAENGI